MTSEAPIAASVGGRSRALRAGWNIADQVLSAATNVVMTFIVARNVSAPDFGAFAVAFMIFALVIGAERALVGSPLSISHSGDVGEARRRTASAALGTSLALTLPVSIGLLVAAPFCSDSVASTLRVLAVVLPFLILQDTCRMAFFAWARPQLATLNDFIWAVLQFSAVAAFIAAGAVSPATMVAAWGGGAVVAAVVGMAQLRAWPRIFATRGWFREHRSTLGYLFLEYLFATAAFQGGLLLIGSLLGLSDIGAIRAAQTLIGPLGIISTGVMTFGVPEVSRHGVPARPMRVAAMTSSALVLISALYTAVLLLIPNSLGTALLGDTWAGAQDVLLPIALGSVVAGGKLGPVILIYGMGRVRNTFRLVATLAVCAVTFMAIGAAVGGVVGLAWGMCLAQAVVVPLWFVQLRALLREPASVEA